MKRFSAAIFLLIALISLTNCSDQNSGTLEIDREYRRAQPGTESVEFFSQAMSYEKLDNGFVEGSFYVLPQMMMDYDYGTSGPSVDPFADPEPLDPNAKPKRLTPQEFLEQAGFQFEEGASAKYLSSKGVLTAVLPEDQMERLAIFLELWFINQERQIGIRAEIYEMPRSMALQLLESTFVEGNHKPERNAAFQAVEDGKAKLVACPSIISRSGQRARVIAGVEISNESNGDESGKDEKTPTEGKQRDLFSGVIFEVDPVLGADDTIIDLNVSLQFAGKSPTGRSAERVKKELTTQLTVKGGDYFLIGNWPSERSGASDLEQVIFITASVQYVGAYGPVEKVSK